MSELRAMLEPPSAAKAEPVVAIPSETPAVETPAAAEPAAEPGDKKLEQETTEEPLPENVQKRIAKEVEKTSRIQREIDQAVSNRKAKERELEQATADKGSQPVKPAQPADARPVKPKLDNFSTYAEWQAASDKYETDKDAWLIAETRKASAQEFKAREQQTANQRTWDAAVKEHGKEFPALMKTVTDQTSEAFQTAVSQLEDWPRVAVHLGKNPAELVAIAAEHGRNPMRGMAALGRLEASLKPAPKAAAAEADPLPEPPKKIGGAAAATSAVDLSDGRISFSAFKERAEKMLKS